MADPYAILLVPTEAGAALLAARRLAGQRWGPECGTRGLALWWDWDLVPEGWDRARRACAEIHDFRPLCSDVLVLARFLASAGLCRVVLLDLVGGALVERAP